MREVVLFSASMHTSPCIVSGIDTAVKVLTKTDPNKSLWNFSKERTTLFEKDVSSVLQVCSLWEMKMGLACPTSSNKWRT